MKTRINRGHRGLSNGASHDGIRGVLHGFVEAGTPACTHVYSSQERVKNRNKPYEAIVAEKEALERKLKVAELKTTIFEKKCNSAKARAEKAEAAAKSLESKLLLSEMKNRRLSK